MPSILEIVRRLHPLHRLRKSRLFRAATRKFDPIVRWRSALLAGPIYLRLVANASIILDPGGQEPGIRETFIALLQAHPKPGGVFWDIGANVGLYTWSCATARPDVAIVAFEPDRKNLECLRRTRDTWRRVSCEIIPCAVAEESGRATFYVDDVSGATGTIEPGSGTFNAVQYGALAPTVEVDTVAIDTLISEGREAPFLIKIDVERAELRVLRGGAKLLRERQPFLLLEAYGERMSTFAFLASCGYRLFDSNRRAAIAQDSVNVLAIPKEVDQSVTDILAALGYPVTRASL